MRRVLILFLVLCVGVAGVALADVAADRTGRGVPGIDVPNPRTVAERVLDRDADEASLTPARCPDDVAGCAAVTGRIVYVERVDPDGDGDLHVVIADGSITAPGLTSVDVRPGLRPERDPGIGDRATAAGPVQTGSKGQSQIHALTFRVAGQ
jgi:hypothetical protein